MNGSIAFCNFNSAYFQGIPNIPQGLGTITTVNLNGDSCDVFGNIYLDPHFVSRHDFDFRLREDSPCIDAGDPSDPLDPDSTIADIGALYYHQSRVLISIGSNTPCIIIPSSGGSFNYWIQVESNWNQSYNFDIWTDAVLPNGTIYGAILSRNNLTIQVGASIQRSLTQYVPGNAPQGFYYLRANVGFFPDSIMDSDEIPFMKLLGDGSAANHNLGWKCYGWDDDKEGFRTQDSGFGILSANPNPFNSSTALSYKLQAASNVKLAVYDIAGREVTVLAEGFYPSGTHQAVWEASSMASGVYFLRLTGEGFTGTQKLILMK